MIKEIKKLEKLGMTPKQAMLFVRNLSLLWFKKGKESTLHLSKGDVFQAALIYPEPFDTQFNKTLSKPIKKK